MYTLITTNLYIETSENKEKENSDEKLLTLPTDMSSNLSESLNNIIKNSVSNYNIYVYIYI